MGEKNTFQVLVEKRYGKKPVGTPRRRQEDNVKRILKKQDAADWSGFVWFKTGNRGVIL
jgi:hypothetical protein